jgi:CheY-like chemotaxis protein
MLMTQVLIVDDDEAIRETLRLILEDAGYTVLDESDGPAALRRLRQIRRPMVVLLDLMMPGMSGASVLEEVAKDSSLVKRFSFILVTAGNNSQIMAISHLLSSVVVPVIRKPWDIEHLLQTVAAAAERISNLQRLEEVS